MISIEELLDLYFQDTRQTWILRDITCFVDYFISNYVMDYLVVNGLLEQLAFMDDEFSTTFLLTVLKNIKLIYVPSIKNGVIAFITELKLKAFENIEYLYYLDAIFQSSPSLINYVYPLEFLMDLLVYKQGFFREILRSIKLLYNVTFDSIYLRETLRIFQKVGEQQRRGILGVLGDILKAGHDSFNDIINYGLLFWLFKAQQSATAEYREEFGKLYELILLHSESFPFNNESLLDLVNLTGTYPQFLFYLCMQLKLKYSITSYLQTAVVQLLCSFYKIPERKTDALHLFELLMEFKTNQYEVPTEVLIAGRNNPMPEVLYRLRSICLSDVEQAQMWLHKIAANSLNETILLRHVIEILAESIDGVPVQGDTLDLVSELLTRYTYTHDYLEFLVMNFVTAVVYRIAADSETIYYRRYVILLLYYMETGVFKNYARLLLISLVYRVKLFYEYFLLSKRDKFLCLQRHEKSIHLSLKLLEQLCGTHALTYEDLTLLYLYVGHNMIDQAKLERRQLISVVIINKLMYAWINREKVYEIDGVFDHDSVGLLSRQLILILAPFYLPNQIKFQLMCSRIDYLHQDNAKYLIIHAIKAYRLIFNLNCHEGSQLQEVPIRYFTPEFDVFVSGPNSHASNTHAPNFLLLKFSDFKLRLCFGTYKAAAQIFEFSSPDSPTDGIRVSFAGEQITIYFFDFSIYIPSKHSQNVNLQITVYPSSADVDVVQDIVFKRFYSRDSYKYGSSIKVEVAKIQVFLNGKRYANMPIIIPYHCCVLMQKYVARLFQGVSYSTISMQNDGWNIMKLHRSDFRVYSIYYLYNETSCTLLDLVQQTLQQIPYIQVREMLQSQGFVKYEDFYDIIPDGNDKIIKCGPVLTLDGQNSAKSAYPSIVFKFEKRNADSNSSQLHFSFKAPFCHLVSASRIQKYALSYKNCAAGFGVLTNIPYLSIFMYQLMDDKNHQIAYNLQYLNTILSISYQFYDSFIYACEFQHLLHFIERKHNTQQITYDVIIQILKLAGFTFEYSVEEQYFKLHSVDKQRLYSMDSLQYLLYSNLWDCDDLYFVFFMIIYTILSDETYFGFLDRYELYQLLFDEVIQFAPKARNMDELLKCLKNVSFSFLIYYLGTLNQFFENNSFSQVYHVSLIINYAFGQCYRKFNQHRAYLVFDIFMNLIGHYVFQFDQYFQYSQLYQLQSCKQIFFIAQLQLQPFVMLLQNDLDSDQRTKIIQVIHIILSAQDILKRFDYESELDPKLYSFYFLKNQNEQLVHIEKELYNYDFDTSQLAALCVNRYINKLSENFTMLYQGGAGILLDSCFIKLLQLKIHDINQEQVYNILKIAAAQNVASSLLNASFLNVPLLLFSRYIDNFSSEKQDTLFFYQPIQSYQLYDYINQQYIAISASANDELLQLILHLLYCTEASSHLISIADLKLYSHTGLFQCQNGYEKMFILDFMFSAIFLKAKDDLSQLHLSLQLVMRLNYILEGKVSSFAVNRQVMHLLLYALRANLRMIMIRYSELKSAGGPAEESSIEQSLLITVLRISFFTAFYLAVRHQGSLRLNVLQYKELGSNYFYPETRLYINDQQAPDDELSAYLTFNLVEVFGMLCDTNTYQLSGTDECSFSACKCAGKYEKKPIEEKIIDAKLSQDYKYLVYYTLLLFNCLQFKQVFSKYYRICHFYIGVLNLLRYQFVRQEHLDIQYCVQLILYQILFYDSRQSIYSTTFCDLLQRDERLAFLKALRLDTKRIQQDATVNINLSENIEFIQIFDYFVCALVTNYAEIVSSAAILSFTNHSYYLALQSFHLWYQYEHYQSQLHQIDAFNYYLNALYNQYSQIGTKRQTSYYLDYIFKSLAAKEIVTNAMVDAHIFATNIDIYTRLSLGSSLCAPGIALHQAQGFNGYNYQRLLPYFYECCPIKLDITPLIVQLFEYFEQLSIPFFNVMLLDHICNKAAKIYIYQQFIYFLVDTPKNQFFPDVANEFGEASSLLMQAVRGAMNAQNKGDDIRTKLNSPQFNSIAIERVLIAKIISIFERDYGGMNSALDLNASDGKCFGIVFSSNYKCRDFIKYVVARQPQMLRIVTSIASNNSRLIQSGDQSKIALMQAYTKTPFNKYLQMLIKSWYNQDVSTFQFITELNLLANRSYSDISQYPIFPLLFGSDLTNHNLLTRVLYLPVICQSKAKLRSQLQKLADAVAFGCQNQQLSSVHYSHCAVSANYMIRIEPWTSSHIMLQQGHIDSPDRLFRSIAIYYSNAIESEQSCEEAIPEYYYDGSIYINSNRIEFGVTYQQEKVWNVQIPSMFDTSQYFVYFGAALLESPKLHAGIFDWIQFMFSDKNTTIDGKDLCNCLGVASTNIDAEIQFYPKITKFYTFKSVDIQNTLQKYQKINQEPNSASTTMKLVYFGRYPREIFSHPKVLRFSEQENFLGMSYFANEFIADYTRMYRASPIKDQVSKQAHSLNIIFELQTAFLACQLIPHYSRSYDCIQPGFLFGRRELFGNIPARSSAGLNYRDDDLYLYYQSPLLKYDSLNEQNSVSYGNNYFLPRNFKYFQNCTGEYVCQYLDCYLFIYSLPYFQLQEVIPIDEANDVSPTHSLSSANYASNEFLICREYGVLDVLGIDFQTGKIVYLQNAALANEPLRQVHYNHAWAVAVVTTDFQLIILNMVQFQIWFHVKIGSPLKDAIILNEAPIMIAVFETYSRNFDLRYAKEYSRIPYVYLSVSGPCMYGISANQIFCIRNYYIQVQKGKFDVEWLGTVSFGSIKSVMLSGDESFIGVDCGSRYLLCTFQK